MPFGFQNRRKHIPGGYPKNIKKQVPQKSAQGSKKDPKMGEYSAPEWSTFFKVFPGGLPGASKAPFWTNLGTFFEGFSTLLYISLPFPSLLWQAALQTTLQANRRIFWGPAVSRRMASSITSTYRVFF